jgi:hypothetical protein
VATPAVYEALQLAGLSVALTVEGGLLLRPKSLLTAQLRALVREHRGELLAWLAPVADPAAWRALATAYDAHHVGCVQCIAAGRGTRYGLRCDRGAALWHAYCLHPP